MFDYRPPGEGFRPLGEPYAVVNGAGARALARLGEIDGRLNAAEARIAQTKAGLAPAISGSELVFTGAKNGFYATQGGCSDGSHYFYFQWNNNTAAGSLVKTDLASFTELGRAPLSLGHGNDMTYCHADGLLYVCGGQGESAYLIYKISPDTLQPVETVTLTEPIYSIAYDRVNRRFFGIGYNCVFRIFDEYLNMQPYSPDPNENPSPCITEGWSSQGSECDNLFIYHCWHLPRENSSALKRIEIFDWNARYLGYAAFTASGELEHCFRVGNYIYAGFNISGGLHLYRCGIIQGSRS